MQLTTKQIKNIHRLPAQTCIQIMHECAERLGAVNVETYCQVHGRKKRAVYYGIKRGRIPSVNIAGYTIPCINEK